MTVLKRVELPSNFGVNVLNLNRVKGGKLSEAIYRLLNPFNVVSRLQFRAAIDMGGPTDFPEVHMVVSKAGSFAAIGLRNIVHIFSRQGNFQLELHHQVTCLCFVTDKVLVTGNSNGDVEVFNLTVQDPIFEAKCVYKFNCGSVYPIMISSDDQETTFHAVVNRGKCMLVFDTIACISGNTDESEVSPTIVDLLQDQPVMDGDCLNSFFATISPTSVYVTDTRYHKGVSFPVESPARCFWASDVGHLFVVNQQGQLIDCAWSDGLVGVSTFPKTIRSKPASVEKTGLVVDPLLVDLRQNQLVTVENNDLLVYIRKQAGNEKQYPVSPIVSEFEIDKQVPIRVNPGEEIVALRITDSRNVCVVIKGLADSLRAAYVAI